MARRASIFRRITLLLLKCTPEQRRALIATMTPQDLLAWDVDFESWIVDGQQEPSGEGWRTWLMMAGRGFGKTRAGAEWISGLATSFIIIPPKQMRLPRVAIG